MSQVRGNKKDKSSDDGVVCRAQRPCRTRPDVTVGRVLAEARRQNGLSISAASRVLRIPERQLEALEEGDLSIFPAEVYARGAFTKYAKFLGVKADGTEHAFQRVLTGAREYVPLRVHRPKSWLAERLTPRWVLAGVVGSVALVVGSYVAWQVALFVWLPRLEIVTPVSNIVYDSTIKVAGRADPSATVHVNGKQAVLAEDGIFSVEFGSHLGINVVQVQATNAAGRTRMVQKDILVPRGQVY